MQSGSRQRLCPTSRRLLLCGAVCGIAYLTLYWANRPGHSIPLGIYFAAMTVAWAGCLVAWREISRSSPTPPRAIGCIVLAALVFRGIGFPGSPIMEDDWFRYLWDGRQFAVAGNPYATSPSQHFNDPRLPEIFAGLLDQINYPHLPTIYAPGLQYAFLLAYGLSAGVLWPLKLLILLADLATARLIYRLGGAAPLLLYSWCPLLIQESCFTAHPELIGAFFTVAAVVLIRESHTSGGGLCLGAAAATKITGGILAPFLLKGWGWRAWVAAAGVWIGMYLPFWLQGSWGDWPTLLTFAREWEFNSGPFALVQGCVGRTAAGPVALGISLAGLLWLWIRQKDSEKFRPDLILGWFLAWSAVVQPWYLLWILPWVALRPTRTGITALITVSLSYLTTMHLGGHGEDLFAHPWWVRLTEYGAIGVALCWDLYRDLGKGRREVAASQSGTDQKKNRELDPLPVLECGSETDLTRSSGTSRKLVN